MEGFWKHSVPPGASLLPVGHLTCGWSLEKGVKPAPSTREIWTPAWVGTLLVGDSMDEQSNESPD